MARKRANVNNSLLRRHAISPKTRAAMQAVSKTTLPTFLFINDPQLNLQASQREDLRALSLALICGVVLHTDLTEYFTRFGVRSSVADAKKPSWLSKPVRKDSRYLVEGKPFAIERVAKLSSARSKLSAKDQALIEQSVQHPLFAKRFVRVCNEYASSVMTASDLRSRITSIVTCPSWNRFINGFTYVKLQFLINLYSVPADDLRAELTEAAIIAIYKRYPSFTTDQHMLNFAMLAARNHAKNLIDETRRDCRDIMLRVHGENRFAITTQTGLLGKNDTDTSGYDPYLNIAGDDCVVYDRITNIPTPKSQETWETERTLDTAITAQSNPRIRRYLNVLRGGADAAFSSYVGELAESYADRVTFEQLQQKASSFFQVSDAESQRVFDSVRQMFAEE